MTDSDPATDLLTDLFDGGAAPGVSAGAQLVDGYDFYDDDPDPNDSSYIDKGDPISQAVGTAGYMSAHVVGECLRSFDDGSQTEPEEFDRYYFPPQNPDYDGPAPVLIDILEGTTPEEHRQEREDKHVQFKTEWCHAHGVSYVVLTDTEDLFLSPDMLRSRISGEDEQQPTVNAPPPKKKPAARRRGVQRVGKD